VFPGARPIEVSGPMTTSIGVAPGFVMTSFANSMIAPREAQALTVHLQ
jgi:hypothetical protein